MRSNKRTIYYIVYIIIVSLTLIIDILFKIFDNTTRKYLASLAGLLFILIVIIEARKK